MLKLVELSNDDSVLNVVGLDETCHWSWKPMGLIHEIDYVSDYQDCEFEY